MRMAPIFNTQTSYYDTKTKNDFHMAARRLDLDALRLSIDTHGSLIVDQPDHEGRTALFNAAEDYSPKNDTTDCMRLLIDAGANANAQLKDGYTALMCIVKYGLSDMFDLFVERGANIHQVTDDGLNALMIAAYNDYTYIVSALLHAGVDASLKSISMGKMVSALDIARENEADGAVELLTRHSLKSYKEGIEEALPVKGRLKLQSHAMKAAP